MRYKAMFNFGLLGCVLCLLSAFGGSSAFDISRPNNLVAYWGASSQEDRISAYCDGSVDAIVIDGLTYQPNALPAMRLVSTACGDTIFPNSSLTDCPGLEADILECQNNGIAVLIYLSNAVTDWDDSEESARSFADLLWALFLGGHSSTRPFGQAPLDGVYIEMVQSDSAQTRTGLFALVDQLRLVSEGDGRRYFWTAATYCEFTQFFHLFDSVFSNLTAIFVDITFGDCSAAHYENKTQWHYGVWDDWVSQQPPHSDFKLFFKVEADDTNPSREYASPSRLAQIANDTVTQYPRYFGGIAYHDAARAASNNGFNVQLRKALSTLALSPASSSSSTGISSAPVTTQNPLPSGGSATHLSRRQLIVSTTIPVLVIVCVGIATLVYLRQRRRRARRGDQDLGASTGELIAPYPPPQHDTPDPWVPPDKWVERKSHSSLPGIPRDSPAETAQPGNAVHVQPPMLQNPEGLAALETEIGRVGLTVPALLASLGRLRTPPSAMSVVSVSETVTSPPEYS